MIKAELIQRVSAQKPHLFLRDAEKVINAILGEIVAALKRGDRVELRGFGAFRVRHRAARNGRNPRNGALVAVNQKNIPHFKAGKEMRKRLNNAQAATSV
jgi:integration host factor subunit beta